MSAANLVDEDDLIGVPKRATFAEFVGDMLEATDGDPVETRAIVTKMLASNRMLELCFWDCIVDLAISATLEKLKDGR